MRYIVQFESEHHMPIDLPEYHDVMKHIEYIREYFELNIKEDINIPWLAARHGVYQICLPYSIAVKSNRFSGTDKITVMVPDGWLNDFMRIFFDLRLDSTMNQLDGLTMSQALDEQNVIFAWELAGFPLEWGFANKEDNE